MNDNNNDEEIEKKPIVNIGKDNKPIIKNMKEETDRDELPFEVIVKKEEVITEENYILNGIKKEEMYETTTENLSLSLETISNDPLMFGNTINTTSAECEAECIEDNIKEAYTSLNRSVRNLETSENNHMLGHMDGFLSQHQEVIYKPYKFGVDITGDQLKCSNCDYRCKFKWTLEIHMLKHTGGNKILNFSQYSYIYQPKAPEPKLKRTANGAKLLLPRRDYLRKKCVQNQANCKQNQANCKQQQAPKRRHSCPKCNYRCNEKSALTAHMSKHVGQKLHCSECRFQTHQVSSLRAHTQKHTEVELLKCSQCGYQCKLQASLRNHLLKHAVQQFKCAHCDYESSNKVVLKEHTRKHVDKFKCSECEFTCIGKDNLKQHVLVRHAEELLPCLT